MALAVSEGCPSRPALKNENGPRRLLSRTGGRLPALQAVSKPDAKAERERHLLGLSGSLADLKGRN